jgi:hypothetical protein
VHLNFWPAAPPGARATHRAARGAAACTVSALPGLFGAIPLSLSLPRLIFHPPVASPAGTRGGGSRTRRQRQALSHSRPGAKPSGSSTALSASCFLPRPRTQDMNTEVVTLNAWASLLLLLLISLPSGAPAPTASNAGASLGGDPGPPHYSSGSALSRTLSSVAELGHIVRDLRDVVTDLKSDNEEFRARVRTMEGRIATMENSHPANAAKQGAATSTATTFQSLPVVQQQPQDQHTEQDQKQPPLPPPQNAGRRLQDDAARGENAVIYRRHLTHKITIPCPGPGEQNGECPPGCTCHRPVWPRCDLPPPPTCGGHKLRRTQSTTGEQCLVTDLAARFGEIQRECCNEATENCRSGMPSSCNAGCAEVVNTFWDECRKPFTHSNSQAEVTTFQTVLHMCADSTSAPEKKSLAQDFGLVCSTAGGAQALSQCIPKCDESRHGHMMLATINEEDSSYSCEIHHGLYSWVGKAGGGGTMGHDTQIFVSTLIVGAAGYYANVVEENDANVQVDITIEPGQHASITGDPAVANDGGSARPTWGSGSFTIKQRGVLRIVQMALQGAVTVASGGSVAISSSTLSTPVDLESGGIASITGGTVPWPTNSYIAVTGDLALTQTSLPALLVVNHTGTLALAQMPPVPDTFSSSFIVHDGATVTVDGKPWSGPKAPSSAVLQVAGAGTAACNGFYKLDGSHDRHPQYCKISDCAHYKIRLEEYRRLLRRLRRRQLEEDDEYDWIIAGHYRASPAGAGDGRATKLPPASGWKRVGNKGAAPMPTLTWL